MTHPDESGGAPERVGGPVCLGEDGAGDLYAVSSDGSVLRPVDAPTPSPPGE